MTQCGWLFPHATSNIPSSFPLQIQCSTTSSFCSLTQAIQRSKQFLKGFPGLSTNVAIPQARQKNYVGHLFTHGPTQFTPYHKISTRPTLLRRPNLCGSDNEPQVRFFENQTSRNFASPLGKIATEIVTVQGNLYQHSGRSHEE